MKILLLSLMMFISTNVIACKNEDPLKSTEPETKRVCIKVYDVKEKREIEKCRVIKIYRPHEATPIPKR